MPAAAALGVVFLKALACIHASQNGYITFI